MKKQDDMTTTPTEHKIRVSVFITVICDIVLIVSLVISLLVYVSSNNVRTYQQNVENISSISLACSRLMQSALDNSTYEIKSAYNYCNGKCIDEILDYLSLVNSSETEYQLLQWNEARSTEFYYVYTGYSTKKEGANYQEIEYANSALANSLHNYAPSEKGEISFSQSFTNKTDALRYYAVFCGISVIENGKECEYFLVKPQKESKILIQTRTITQYLNVSLAICYKDGKYLACDNGYRADNFYDYLYKYNNLSMDEKLQIKDSIQNNENGTGILTYKDSRMRDSVFVYTMCGNADKWIVIVSVPTHDFVSEQLLPFFPIIIIIFMAVLLVFNVWRLLIIVNELKRSVYREKIASNSKSAFLSRMSHEIRTPLNAIIGYNTIAQSDMKIVNTESERKQAETKVLDSLGKSEIASKHLLTIINDVLDMSAIEGGKVVIAHERFDFRGLITSLTTIFYSQARAKGVTFDVVFDTLTEEWFVGDQMRVNQILTNLLSNAIKFTASGGYVTLKINQPEAERDAAHIHFEVSDSGIGMTQEYLTHIWVPFEQEDSSISRRFGGSGLGLSITKNLVDLMGGSISVTSEQGVGTTFAVDLTFETAERPKSSEVYDFSTVNALVVDDDISTCDYVRLLFNRCGAKCAAVNSGADALKAVSIALERKENYTMCLVDWRMPEMDGIETIKRIRELVGDKLPIIVLTAYDYSELAEDANKVGVNKFISKPLFQSSLFDLLASICGVPSEVKMEKKGHIEFAGEHLLLAEDNAMNMEIAKKIMQSAGLKVDCAWNGKEAVELFEKSEAGEYMAILMDVHMPEMNGHDATRMIRSLPHPDATTIPIIAMTADAFAENVAEAYAAGMNGHISKPINIPVLFETLSKYLRN